MSRIDEADLWPEVDAALERRARNFFLPPELLSLCREYSFDARRRATLDWGLWTMLILIVCTPVNIFYRPDLTVPSLLSNLVLMPLCCLALFLVWRRPRGPTVEALGTGVMVAGVLATAYATGSMLGGMGLERAMLFGAFAMTVCIVVVPLEMRQAAALVAFILACYVLTQLFNPHLATAELVVEAIYLAATSSVLLVARRMTTITQWRGILMRLRDARRAASLAEANRQLAVLATRDMLTGLHNRRAMNDALAASVEVLRAGQPLALAMLDLDEFKRLNDTLGHAEGDRCLMIVGRLIADHIAASHGTAARIGGEEFLLLLPSHDAAAAVAVVEGIRQALEEMALPHPASRVSDRVSLSAGVAAVIGADDRPAADVEALQRAADRALYEAKGGGRNRAVLAEGDGDGERLAQSAA